jgi:phosphoribosylformylglycinamidine cyclo-ligase
VVERSKIIDGKSIRPGDALIGLASTGLHSNGYSLARKVLIDSAKDPVGPKLLDQLLEPTRIYVKDVQALMDAVDVKGMAHITGSGIPGNLPRCLPEGTRAVLEESSWRLPPIFELIQSRGNVARDEMYATFNMGLGLIAVVASPDVPAARRALQSRQVDAWEVGRIEKGEGEPTATIVP